MVSVPGIGGVAAPAPGPARRGEAGFQVPADATARATIPASATEGIAGMLALQEQEADSVQDRNARRHGQAVLRELAALQRALLDGVADGDALARLSALVGAAPRAADPALAGVLRAVGLRAEVALARRGR